MKYIKFCGESYNTNNNIRLKYKNCNDPVKRHYVRAILGYCLALYCSIIYLIINN